MNIEYDGYSYFIETKENENKNSLIDRSWYISKNKPRNEDEYHKILKKSNIFINIQKLKCNYNQILEKNI